MTPSAQQQAVIDHLNGKDGNVVVEALAGTGKTALIKMAFESRDIFSRDLYLVFNKKNQEEAASKMPRSVQVCTLNSYGNSMCRKAFGYYKIDADKCWYTYLYKIRGLVTMTDEKEIKKSYKLASRIKRAVSLLKGHAVMTGQQAVDLLPTLMERYDIEVDEEDQADFVKHAVEVLILSNRNRKILDFDDQIYLPLLEGLSPAFRPDLTFVDECQDLNQAKIMMATGIGSRLGIVGDRRQAIYGFAGADTQSMQRLIELVNGPVFPLTVNYRCSKAVIAEAQKDVPEIQACDTAPEGKVDWIPKQDFRPQAGDYVICRTVAPLVSGCLALIRSGQKATVLGRELGQGLKDMVEPYSGKSCKEALIPLQDWYQRELTLKQNLNKDTTALSDKYDTIMVLMESVDSINELVPRIDSLFSDTTSSGITFMSGHKSKGLEANNVYVLRPDLLPHPNAEQEWQKEQEANLRYVIRTRARVNLTYVEGK